MTWEDSGDEEEYFYEEEQPVETVEEDQTADQTADQAADQTQISPQIEVRDGRVRRHPSYLSDYVTGDDDEEDEVNMVEIYSTDPLSFEEAEKSPKWREAMDDKSNTCIFFGFSEESKGYRLYNPQSKKVIVSRDVVFEESKGWNWEEERDHTNTELI
jgi:hypothetical protein